MRIFIALISLAVISIANSPIKSDPLAYVNRRAIERTAAGKCTLYLNFKNVDISDIARIEEVGYRIKVVKPKDKSRVKLNGFSKISWCHRRHE